MATTKNYHFPLTIDSELQDKKFVTWREDINGDSPNSLAMLVDTELKKVEDKTDAIPTKVSDLKNDRNFQTEIEVNHLISNLVGSAPEALDTLKELADALGNDPNFATTMTNALANKEALIKNANMKTTLSDNDSIPLSDSESSNVTKKITYINLKSILKKYFDGLYNKYVHPNYPEKPEGLYKIIIDDTGHITSTTTVKKEDITVLGIPSENTDNKVTNTLAPATKAYITGTTNSSTNTGTQVFDNNVYLDTIAGQLVANKFKGELVGNASTATKLQTVRKINGVSFDGSSDINITANPNSHKHSKSEITDFPTSLPANGGDSESVGGIKAGQLLTNNKLNLIDIKPNDKGGLLWLRDNVADGNNDSFGGLYLGSAQGIDFILGKHSNKKYITLEMRTHTGSIFFIYDPQNNTFEFKGDIIESGKRLFNKYAQKEYVDQSVTTTSTPTFEGVKIGDCTMKYNNETKSLDFNFS